MAYPNNPIQRQYNVYQSPGMLGQIAVTDNNTFFFDVATAGVEMRPGDGVYLDTAAGATKGQWIKPTTEFEQVLVTHVVSFDPTSFNTPLTVAAGNQTNEVLFAAGTPAVKAVAVGSVYIQPGGDITRGQAIVFDQATDKWLATELDTKSTIIALEDGSNGGTIAVRNFGQTRNVFEEPNPVFTFASDTITWTGGLATLAVTVTGATVSDRALVTIAGAPTEAAYLVSADITAADTLTITLSAANTSNDAVIYYEIRRAQ